VDKSRSGMTKGVLSPSSEVWMKKWMITSFGWRIDKETWAEGNG
jgi:hypothetical protein